MHQRRWKDLTDLLLFHRFAAYLELAKFKLNHILTGGQHKNSWEQFCVRLHLQEDNTVLCCGMLMVFLGKASPSEYS